MRTAGHAGSFLMDQDGGSSRTRKHKPKPGPRSPVRSGSDRSGPVWPCVGLGFHGASRRAWSEAVHDGKQGSVDGRWVLITGAQLVAAALHHKREPLSSQQPQWGHEERDRQTPGQHSHSFFPSVRLSDQNQNRDGPASGPAFCWAQRWVRPLLSGGWTTLAERPETAPAYCGAAQVGVRAMGWGGAAEHAREMGSAKAVPSRADPSWGAVVEEEEEEEELGRAGLTGYLRLDARLVVGAEQLRLDGFHHALKTPTWTWQEEQT